MTSSPTRPTVSVGLATDAERFLATDRLVWFQGLPVASTDERLLGLAEDQRFAADIEGADPTTYPGVYGVFPLSLNVPGPDGGLCRLPCAGLSWVGVHPDHRRQGVLSAMMRHHLEQTHEEADTHVSALHASEPAIYGRYGYGLASLELQVGLVRGTTLTAPELEEAAAAVTTQLATVSDAGMPVRMRAAHLRAGGLGAVVGEIGFYERVSFEPPDQLRDKEPTRVLFARRDGEDVGFAVFRRAHKWENARPAGELSVWLLVGDPAAELVLLRRLVDFDLMGSVSFGKAGVDDPLFLWAGGPRATADVATYDSLWVRLVDLPDALQDRTWTQPCDIVVEVDDVSAPWNQGSWRIRADDSGHAHVEKTSDDADLRLPVQALGAAYLGGGSLAAQQRAGLVVERRAGAVSELSRALRTELAPGAAMGF